MIGHRRPSSLASALARSALIVCAFLTGSAWSQEVPPPNEPLRVRITWGGGEPSRWTGTVSLDQGALSNLKLLGLDADAAGSVWIEQSQVRIASLSAHKSDSIEVTAQAGPDSKLLIDFAAAEKTAPVQAQVPLSDLRQRAYQLRLDDRGSTLEIELVPNSALRVATNHDSLIFAPGEQFSFELTPVLADSLPGTTLDIQTTLSPARRKDALWTDNQRLAIPVNGHPKVVLDVPLPRSEGVYTIHIAAMRPPGFRQRFLPAAAAPLAERSFQVTVLDSNPPAPSANARWDAVLEIDPTNPRWVERLPSWTQFRRIPGLNRGPLGSIRAGSVKLALGQFIELPPTVAGADPHWQAYSLPLEAVGVPHMLEIDFPADAEQQFGISIVEPNAAGIVEGINRDAGVYVEGLGRSEATQKQTQRLIFWPRTQAPLLIVTNQHPSAPAHFGQIRVLKRTGQLSPATTGPAKHDRLIAAYLARPLAPETFGATQSLEINSPKRPKNQSVDDCQTFYESATRMADYVRYGGYNCAVVCVMAEGSAIFPSPQSLFTPRYDTGRFAEQVRDTDGLELLLRVFDREQLALVPAIEFTTPLPQLEKLRRSSDPQTSGLEPIGPNGLTWIETNGTRNGQAPFYNLLDPRVQQTMLGIVREIVERYGGHRAFGGLAIQLSGDGYAQLSSLEWGLDDATITRFERDTNIQLPAAGADRFATRHKLLTGPHAEAWRAWRAAQVTAFYGRLAAQVRAIGDHRLLLTTEKLFDHPQTSGRVRPNLLVENRVASTLLELGLDRQSLEREPGIVFCPTRYVEPTLPLSKHAVDLELNKATAQARRQPDSDSQPATLLYHRPTPLQLASFKARSPFAIADEMQLVCQPVAQGFAVRQPYLQALLDNDPSVLVDGGDLLPLGQEDLLRGVRSLIAELPASAQVAEVAKQPVVIRTYSEGNRVTFVAINMSPWRADAQVTFDVSQATTLETLTVAGNESAAAPSKQIAAGRQSWLLNLEPYDVQAVRIVSAGAKVVEVRAELGKAAKAELKTQLADLANRDLTAPRDYRALANPSFEPLGGATPVAGWRLTADADGAAAELDATVPQDGKTCLYLRGGGRPVALESDTFPMPATGQLAMTVFARGQNIGPQTELRLVFESEIEGQVFRRSASARGAEIERPNQQWGRPLAILVNDLPLEMGGLIRIKFELTGPGEVWLDNVKLHDLLFPLEWYGNAQPEILQLLQRTHEVQSAYDAGQVSDCLKLLDGYWPRFVMTYTPPTQPKMAVAPAPQAEKESPPQPDQGEQASPSVSERIKRFVPIWR